VERPDATLSMRSVGESRVLETLEELITNRAARFTSLTASDTPAVTRRIEQRILAEASFAELGDPGQEEVVVELCVELVDHVTTDPGDAVLDDRKPVGLDEVLGRDVFELAARIGEVLADIDLVCGQVRHREPTGLFDECMGLVLR